MTDIKTGYTPGLIGRVVELHATYYHAHWGFGAFFEAKVASEMAAFMSRYDPGRDCVWHASVDGVVQGSLTIDGHNRADLSGDDGAAHLRWFIISPALQGKGIGQRLMANAVAFCKSKQYSKIYLSTFEGLHAARHLYERAGFRLVSEQSNDDWGVVVNQQLFEMRI